MKCWLLSISFIVLAFAGNANSFDFNQNCRSAYEQIIKFKFEEGKRLIAQEKAINPNNDAVILLDNYLDFFHTYIKENESDFLALEPNKEIRLAEIEENGDRNSPYYLYAQAAINLHWALSRSKHNQFFKAFREGKKAYKLLKENEQKFPDFLPNKMYLSLIETLIGTLPDNYQWGLKIFGMSGDAAEGLKNFNTVVGSPEIDTYFFYEEAKIIEAFLAWYIESDNQKAYRLVNEPSFPLEDNLFGHFIAGDICFRTGHNDEAIRFFESAPRTASHIDYPFLDYMLGITKLNRLDSDARPHIQRYLNDHKGAHYIKEAYQKLAWTYLIEGDENQYRSTIKNAGVRGSTMVDADKQALKESQKDRIPNINLLKARLLFDGGYYTKAADILNNLSLDSFSEEEEKLEYVYRKARVYEMSGKIDQAIQQYVLTISQGGSMSYYFMPKASLQLGRIYEARQNMVLAKRYYEQVLSYKKHEYKDSLDQQAKAGLNRL